MQTIRKNVFETNSSSSHSLTMDAADVVTIPFSKEELRSGSILVGLGEYGWEWHRYYSPKGKIAYLLTQLLCEQGTPSGTAESATAELCAENNKVAILCEVVKEHTGCYLLIAPDSGGYVDHESVGLGIELFDDKEALRKFIFSENSFVETGNDNSSPRKTIETDKGYSEEYYVKHYKEPEPGWIDGTLVAEGCYSLSIKSPSGASIDETFNADVRDKLNEQATVIKAHWQIAGMSNPFGYDDLEGYTISTLAWLGFKVQSKVEVSYEFSKIAMKEVKEKAYRKLVLDLKMSPDLATELAKL